MRAITVVTMLGLAACASQEVVVGNVGAPIALDRGLVYLDTELSSLIYAEPERKSATKTRLNLRRVSAGEHAVLAVAVPIPEAPERRRLLVSDAGRAEVLAFDDMQASPRVVATGVPLEALDVAADGTFAVSYQPEGTSPTGSLFAFPNTVAVLDLRAGSFGGRVVRLGAGDARPLKAVFAERLQFETLLDVGQGPTPTAVDAQLALLFVRGGLVPLDLAHGTAGKRIPLTPEPDADIVPAEVLFSNNQGDDSRGTLDGIERVFVRSREGEIYVVSLMPAVNSQGSVHVRVALENVITPTAPVADIELFFRPDGSELLLAAAGQELVLVDGETGVASHVALDAPVDSLRRYLEPGSNVEMALAYSHASPASTLWRVQPLELAAHRASGLQALRLGSPVAEVSIAAGETRAVLRYENARDLGVLDLGTREVLDLRFAAGLDSLALSTLGDLLWVAAPDPSGIPSLAEVTLDGALSTRQVALDKPGAAIGRVGDFLFVDHGERQGALTVFPYDRLQRDAAVTVAGLALTDLLTEPLPAKE